MLCYHGLDLHWLLMNSTRLLAAGSIVKVGLSCINKEASMTAPAPGCTPPPAMPVPQPYVAELKVMRGNAVLRTGVAFFVSPTKLVTAGHVILPRGSSASTLAGLTFGIKTETGVRFVTGRTTITPTGSQTAMPSPTMPLSNWPEQINTTRRFSWCRKRSATGR